MPASVYVTLDGSQIATTAGSMVSAWIDHPTVGMVCVGVNKDSGGNIVPLAMSPIAGISYFAFSIVGEAGLTVSFKAYDKDTDTIYDLNETVAFDDTTTYGSMPEPQELTVAAGVVGFTVTFDPGDYGTIPAGSEIQTVEDGDFATAPVVTEEAGYTFIGWSPSDPATTPITEDTTFTAQYEIQTFTVTFLGGDHGSVSGDTVQTVNYGEDAVAPTVEANPGYAFTDWDEDITNVTGNLNVTAQYQIKTFTVMFIEGENGTITDGNAVQIVNYGEAAVAPAITSNTGWIFIGWDKTFDNITQNTAVNAIYESRQWTVIFDAGIGGEITGGDAEQTIANGAAAISPTITPNEGWIFTGWDTDFSVVEGDLTITALYDIQTFTVSFNSGDYGVIISGDAVQTVEYGDSAIEPIVAADNFMRFIGWSDSFDNVIGELTITAQYAQAGDGTADNPYQISTIEELEAVNNDFFANYLLVNDISLSERAYDDALISEFAGTFDGNGLGIYDLSVRGGSYSGLFGYIRYNARISNLCIDNAVVVGEQSAGVLAGINDGGIIDNCSASGSVEGSVFVGGLIAYDYSGIITRCNTDVLVVSNGYGYNNEDGGIGGLIGMVASSESKVADCYATGDIVAPSCVGGLVGINYGTIKRCYTWAAIEGYREVGGLVGINYNLVEACYSTGDVTGEMKVGGLIGRSECALISNSYCSGTVVGSWYVGGLIGSTKDSYLENCYSTATVNGDWFTGGLVGENIYSEAYNCFWDWEASNKMTSTGGISQTTAQMQDVSTFLDGGWDFVNEESNGQMYVWYISEGDYPRLYWQAAKGDMNYDGTVDPSDLFLFAENWLSRSRLQERIVADINADGVVNLLDYYLLGQQW
jgi:hypothetical protein